MLQILARRGTTGGDVLKRDWFPIINSFVTLKDSSQATEEDKSDEVSKRFSYSSKKNSSAAAESQGREHVVQTSHCTGLVPWEHGSRNVPLYKWYYHVLPVCAWKSRQKAVREPMGAAQTCPKILLSKWGSPSPLCNSPESFKVKPLKICRKEKSTSLKREFVSEKLSKKCLIDEKLGFQGKTCFRSDTDSHVSRKSGVECEEWVGAQGKNTLELQMRSETKPFSILKPSLKGSFTFWPEQQFTRCRLEPRAKTQGLIESGNNHPVP